MQFDFQTFIAELSGRDTSAGVTAMGAAQAPTDDELAEDSADSAELFGGGDADGPDVEPTYEPARPLIDETHAAALIAAVRSVLLGVPVPAGSVSIRNTVATTPVMVAPPSGGRARSCRIVNAGAATAYLSTDRPNDTTQGYPLAAGADLDTATQGAVWAVCASGDSTTVGVWIDHYDTPTSR